MVTIKELNKDLTKDFYKIRSSFWKDISEEDHIKEINAVIKNDNQNAFIAFSGDKAIGYIETSLDKDSNTGHVEGWYVEEEARGKGVGKQLVMKAEKWAKDKGAEKMVSECRIYKRVSAMKKA